MTSLKAAIFDLDDTLFDDTACMYAGLNALIQAYAIKDTDAKQLFQRHWEIISEIDPLLFSGQINAQEARKRRYEKLLAELGVQQPDGLAATQIYRKAYQAHWSVIEGGPELLTTLRERGLKIGVLTNYISEIQTEKLAHCGLTPLVDVMLCVDEIPAAKPDPRSYQAICECLEIKPTEAIMIGDHWENDVQGAIRFNMSAIWLNRHDNTTPNPEIPEVTELKDVLNYISTDK